MPAPEQFVMPRPGWPSRLVDRVLGGLSRLGMGRDWFRPEAVLAKARRTTGLHELGVPGFEERTARLVDSMARQADPTALGRATIHGFLLDSACNRLRLTELLRRHPEIEQIPVEQPVFIVGWPRTGTTALHDLMSLDPGLYGPPLWALRNPVPTDLQRGGDPAPRIARGEHTVAISRRLAPAIMAVHPLHAHLPDECQFLFDNDMFTASFTAFQAHDYGRWMLRTDATALYRSYRTQLQVLLWDRPPSAPRRLVLKWPFHLWHLDALLAVFPDARIVQTHRAVDQALASFCNLNTIIQSMFNRSVDPQQVGAMWLELAAEGIERSLAARDGSLAAGAGAAARVCDLLHARLVKDHVGEISLVYEALELPWPSDMPRRIEGYLAEQPRGHQGRHHYRMEWFGLDPGLLAERFAAYHERFGDLFEAGMRA